MCVQGKAKERSEGGHTYWRNEGGIEGGEVLKEMKGRGGAPVRPYGWKGQRLKMRRQR